MFKLLRKSLNVPVVAPRFMMDLSTIALLWTGYLVPEQCAKQDVLWTVVIPFSFCPIGKQEE